MFVFLMAFVTFGIDAIYRNTRLGFFVHNRQAPPWQIALSAAASWMYVFGIILAAEFPVRIGMSSTFWLIFANVTALFYFGFMGYQLLSKMPSGFTFSEFIHSRYNDTKMSYFYRTLHVSAAIYAIIISLTGFGVIAEYVSKDFNYDIIVLVLGLTILCYSMWGGIKASLRTDTIQVLLIIFVSVVFGSIAVFQAGGLQTVLTNWDVAKPTEIFTSATMLNPGLLLILLCAGSIMADNGHYQKVIALGEKSKIIKTYFFAGMIVLICYSFMALLSASAFSLPITISNPKVAALQVTDYTIGYYGILIFTLAILAKASSTTDTALNSAGTVIANDVFTNWNSLWVSRLTMIVVMSIAILISMMKIDLWILFTTFGAIRMIAIAPTLYALFTEHKFNTNLLFMSMLVATVFAIFSIYFKWLDSLTLSLIMIGIPLSVILFTKLREKMSWKTTLQNT
jgi:Na+/proline symporter